MSQKPHEPGPLDHALYQRVCSICGQEVPSLEEWQSVTGQVFIGHRDCAEAEAAKYVMVERSMLQEAMRVVMGMKDAPFETYARWRQHGSQVDAARMTEWDVMNERARKLVVSISSALTNSPANVAPEPSDDRDLLPVTNDTPPRPRSTE